jgi:hypothetical protein
MFPHRCFNNKIGFKSRRMRWAGHVARIGCMCFRNAYGIFVRKPEEKRPFGRPRYR